MPRPPAPLIVQWRSGAVRIRHDDPALKPYSPRASVLLAAMTLASTADGLQRVIEATLGQHYRVQLREGEPVTVGLWRR